VWNHARYECSGNVRELQNIIERCVILSSGTVLHYPPLGELRQAGKSAHLKVRTLAEAEREHILRTLRETDWVIGGPHGGGNAGWSAAAFSAFGGEGDHAEKASVGRKPG
jgi:hypothetical protein